MKEYLKKNGIRLAVILLAVVIVVSVSSQLLGGSAGFLTNIIVAVREPINKAATAAGSLLDGLYGYIFEYEQLQAELEATRNELADAQEQVDVYKRQGMSNAQRAAALRRRMNGEGVPIPTIAGEKLGEVLRRCLAFPPESRYADTIELSMALEPCVGAVSYTHLDVYKRQGCRCSRGARPSGCTCGRASGPSPGPPCRPRRGGW